jgi:predicted transcriptional regulator of viral defense system
MKDNRHADRDNAARTVPDYVDHLQSLGQYTFTRNEVEASLGKSSLATESSLRRLKEKGRIVSPRRGFFVIVPLEYRSLGSLPASWFVHEFMFFLDQLYYVGILSAAELHGAAHQHPQVFQVVTAVPTRPVQVSRIRIEFHVKSNLESTPTVQMQTEAGYLTVSTPEATALDLIRYYRSGGGLDNVATVLRELAEHIDPQALAAAAALVEQPIAQRLGHVLDVVGQEHVTVPLSRLVSSRGSRATPLRPDLDWKGITTDNRWRVIPNVEIQSDL